MRNRPGFSHNAEPMAGLTLLKEKVAAAVGAGADLKEVEEDVIERAPLEPDVRDALWLYAWTLSEQAQRPGEDAR